MTGCRAVIGHLASSPQAMVDLLALRQSNLCRSFTFLTVSLCSSSGLGAWTQYWLFLRSMIKTNIFDTVAFSLQIFIFIEKYFFCNIQCSKDKIK